MTNLTIVILPMCHEMAHLCLQSHNSEPKNYLKNTHFYWKHSYLQEKTQYIFWHSLSTITRRLFSFVTYCSQFLDWSTKNAWKQGNHANTHLNWIWICKYGDKTYKLEERQKKKKVKNILPWPFALKGEFSFDHTCRGSAVSVDSPVASEILWLTRSTTMLFSVRKTLKTKRWVFFL